MNARDPYLDADRVRVARRWLEIAREDARVARSCRTLDPPATTTAAYHCQQAAEKLVKGLLVLVGVHFPKTHDTETLGDLASAHYPEWHSAFAAVHWLSDWAWAYRYPSMEEEPDPTAEELDRALSAIQTLSEHLQQALEPDKQTPANEGQ